MIILKIDVSKIDKRRIFKGKKGSYLELVVMENRDGEDQYGNTHMVVEGVTKEEREQGVRGTILGNGKEFNSGRSQPQRGGSTRGVGLGNRGGQRYSEPEPQGNDMDDDIPF